MSTAEILKELPTLNQDDRQEILNRLCDLQERDLLSGRGPSAELRKLLDEELEDSSALATVALHGMISSRSYENRNPSERSQ